MFHLKNLFFHSLARETEKVVVLKFIDKKRGGEQKANGFVWGYLMRERKAFNLAKTFCVHSNRPSSSEKKRKDQEKGQKSGKFSTCFAHPFRLVSRRHFSNEISENVEQENFERS